MGKFKILFGKYIYILAVVSLLGTGGLFAFLKEVGLEPGCDDSVARVNTITNISCWVYNPTYKSKYLYNYGDWKITFSPNIVDVDIYAKYYGKWRFTNFTRETRFSNIADARKYVFVFPARTTKWFQIRVNVSKPSRIKWDFGTLDPLIISWDIEYENKSEPCPVYREDLIEVKEDCFTNITTASIQCNLAYNYPTKTLIRYDTCYYQGDRIGLNVAGDICYDCNIKGNILSKWDVPIGDRNFEKYGECLEHEKRKRVCREIDLLK